MLRNRKPELMDDPALDRQLHLEALKTLMRLNKASGSYNTLWQPIEKLAGTLSGRPLRVLDLATGYGDVPINLYHKAKEYAIDLEVSGCDISSRAIEFAREHARQSSAEVEFFKLDVLNDSLPDNYDVIITSLFFHHIDEPDIETLMKSMFAKANHMVLVNDLIRSKFNYWLIYLITRIATRSKIVRYDGPVSIQAAFTMDEMDAMARKAGAEPDKFSITEHFPCRFIFKWEKEQG